MTVLIFIKDFLVASLGLTASLFLVIFIFGILIQLISQLTFKSLANAFGPGGTYVVAWLGTPIHELGHALFCLVFFHKITDIRFFKPDEVTGTIGYVNHKWNPKNPWQVAGNFFIGIGPMILGSAVLFALFYFLIPGSGGAWSSIVANMRAIESSASIMSYLTAFKDAVLAIISLVFTYSNLGQWQFWVFLYLSICVASNIRLSRADLKGSLSGIGCIIIPVLILTLILMLAGKGAEAFYPYIGPALGMVYSLLTLALVLGLTGFVLIYVFSAAVYRLKYRGILNPFR